MRRNNIKCFRCRYFRKYYLGRNTFRSVWGRMEKRQTREEISSYKHLKSIFYNCIYNIFYLIIGVKHRNTDYQIKMNKN